MGKKSKKNNKKDDYWDEEFEADAPTATEEPESGEASGTATPSNAEDEFGGDFMANLKKAKNKKQEKKKKEEEDKATATANKGPVIKTKKEKERERKEREKERKKQLAARKKASQAAQSGQDKKSSSQEPEETKEEPEAAPASATAPTPTPAKKKKAKKVPAGLALLRKQMELRKQAEEEQSRLQEEERLAEVERIRKIEEEEKAEAEAKIARKEREKAKIAQLKKEGKYLTKKQKQERALMARRREALLASGNITVAGLSADGHEGGHRKVSYGTRKKKSHSKEATPEVEKTPVVEEPKVEPVQEETPTPEDEVPEDVAQDIAETEDVVEDWEALAEEEGVAESWEDLEDEAAPVEATAPKVKEPKATPKAAPNVEEKSKAAPTEAPKTASPSPSKVVAPASPVKEAKQSKKSKSDKQEANTDNLRSPICCILGHVDTGKTKLLDKIRQTNVQGGEAGGITQQIGATYFPLDALKQKTAVMSKYEKLTYDVPGLLVIDTPGHESFTNLRSRGSSLCNIAILVIDIMHGLEQQTLESIRLLRDRKAPFVVALNKIDRLYGWQTTPNNSFRDSFSRQSNSVQSEFERRYQEIKVQLSEQGLNSELYFQNSNMARYVSIVPTSAVTGEGVPDLLWLLLELTQKRMSKQLKYLTHVEATILEVKVVEGLGTTIDVVLSNGILHEGDRIVLCGMNGPIVTNIRALLTPPPSRELRIKSEYVHHKEVKAALGVKITANDLEKAVAGSRLLVVGPDDDEDELADQVMDDVTGLLDSVDPTGRGVTVQASTLGSLEALLDFLKDMKIPVMSIGLGPVYKRDVMKATAMLDKAPEYAVMLCFDVKVDKEAEQYAQEQHIRIFNAEVIYHLFDSFTLYQEQLLEKRREENKANAIFPCVLKTIQIINKRNPMIIGVDVVEGVLKLGTPIGAVKLDPTTGQRVKLPLGKVVSMEVNHMAREEVRKGDTAAGVAIRLGAPSSQPTWGRHVDENDPLYSLITRKTIDTLKDPAFRSSVKRDDWILIKKLKPVLDIE